MNVPIHSVWTISVLVVSRKESQRTGKCFKQELWNIPTCTIMRKRTDWPMSIPVTWVFNLRTYKHEESSVNIWWQKSHLHIDVLTNETLRIKKMEILPHQISNIISFIIYCYLMYLNNQVNPIWVNIDCIKELSLERFEWIPVWQLGKW